MKHVKELSTIILMMFLILSISNACLGAGKTYGAYKCNVFTGQSDCSAMII